MTHESATALELFAQCVLPDCANPVADQGNPCPDCERACAGFVRAPSSKPAATSRYAPPSAHRPTSPALLLPPTPPHKSPAPNSGAGCANNADGAAPASAANGNAATAKPSPDLTSNNAPAAREGDLHQ